MAGRRVLIIHPDAARRRELRSVLEGTEVVEVESRAAAVPLLAKLDPTVVLTHPEGFRKLLRDLERHAPGAVRAVLCPKGDDALRRALVDVAAEGYDFVSLEEGALEPVRALVSPRGSGRFVPERPLVGRFTVGPTPFLCHVRELGNEGLSLAVPSTLPSELLVPGVRLTDAAVDLDGQCVLEPHTWVVRSVRPPGPNEHALQVGVAFAARDEVGQPAALPVADPVRVRGLIRRAVSRPEPFTIAFATGADQRAFDVESMEEETLRLRLKDARFDHPFSPPDIVQLTFELNGINYEGLAAVVECGQGTAEVAIPGFLRRRHRRRSLRLRFGPDQPAFITLTNPLTGAVSTRPLIDLHPGGAAFEMDTATEVLPPGLVLPLVSVEAGELSFTCSAVVQGTSSGWRSDTVWTRRCGLKLTGIPEASRYALVDATLRSWATEVLDGGAVDSSAIWNLFRSEGVSFPDYEAGGTCAPPCIEQAQRLLRNGVPGLGKTFLHRGTDGTLVGHASGLRVYSGTWLAQHLLVRRGYRRATHVSKLVIGLTYDYGEAIEGVEYTRGLWRLSNRWSSRVFGSVTSKLTRPGLSCLTTYEPMRLPVGTPLPDSPLSAHPARPEDDLHLLQHLRRTTDPVRLRADDLVEGQLRLESISAKYASSGLGRTRSIAVVDGADGPRGWVLVENLSPGLFWPEIYSCFKMTLADQHAADADDVRLALVRFGVWAAQRAGRHLAVVHATAEDKPLLERLGFQTLGPILEFDAHRTMTRDVTTQLMSVFERLDARSRRQEHPAPGEDDEL